MSDLEKAKANLHVEFARYGYVNEKAVESVVKSIVAIIPESIRSRYDENDWIAAWEYFPQWKELIAATYGHNTGSVLQRRSEVARQQLYELLLPMGFAGLAVETAIKRILELVPAGANFGDATDVYIVALKKFPKWIEERDAYYRDVEVNLFNELARLGYTGDKAIEFIHVLVNSIPSYARENFSDDLYTAAWEYLPKQYKRNYLRNVDDKLYELLAVRGIVGPTKPDIFIAKIEASIPSAVRHIYSKNVNTAALEYFPIWEKLQKRNVDKKITPEMARYELIEKLGPMGIIGLATEYVIDRIFYTIPDDRSDLYNQDKYIAALEYFPEWKAYINTTSIEDQLHDRLSRIGRDTDDLEFIVDRIVDSIPSEIRSGYSDDKYTAALDYLPEWEKMQPEPVDEDITPEDAKSKLIEKLGPMGYKEKSIDIAIDRIVCTIPEERRNEYSQNKYIAAMEFFHEWKNYINSTSIDEQLHARLARIGRDTNNLEVIVDRIELSIPSAIRSRYSDDKYTAALEYLPEWNRLMNL